MSIGTSRQDGVLVVSPPPRLDTLTSPDAEKALAEAIAAGDTRLVVDLDKTVYVSSAGLRVILKTAKLAEAQGGSLALCGANVQVREVLEISGFLGILTYCNSLKEALGKVRG